MLRSIFSTQQLPTEKTMSPADVAAEVGRCVAGESPYRSGEVIWLSK
jgi:ornithine cyclodeaminase/alanine dehydrogenase-like protein (mu-crystallin family)